MIDNTCSTRDRIYDAQTGWQADPSTGLNLVHGKTAATPTHDDHITALKQTVQNRYNTGDQPDRDQPAAEQRAIDRLKRRAADHPDIPKVAATSDTSLDRFTESEAGSA